MISLVRKVLLCAVFLLSLVWYGSTHFYRDPGSVFFDKTRAFEQRYSTYRMAEVRQLIHDLKDNSGQQIRREVPGTNASLCVTSSSVSRKGSSYLETTMVSLLHGLTGAERKDLYINILNAEINPSDHPSWNEAWLHDAVDRFETYSFSGPEEEEYIKGLSQKGAYAEKGIYDYTTALRGCLDSGTPYIAFVEDDVLFADGWMMQALSALGRIPALDNEHRQWLFMRLFNQERSMGWAGKGIGENHEYLIILGIASGVLLASIVLRQRWRWTRRYLDLETLFVIVTILIPGLVILFYQCGKASLLPRSPGVFDEPFGCCSQALIFPRESIPLIIEYMQEQKRGQFDLMLDQLAAEVGYSRYAMYPVQAQHIGLESARMTERDEAQAIWSMAFEDLKPNVLKTEHLRLARLRYGSSELFDGTSSNLP
ncbi:uncharacterized protein RCC_08669 [Ramularia collo-cygni]|uniref:Integral membrane protein n=1 Tax=Ramularia collo-cygni TaxID=112498 RepID=A0A2D3VFQ7_9PEZI|nr:uncharacterized protein RCC_08669 [Ramularia collo-cygni]CZT22961.1 uncharacterized protein RCC_08669 [Ramularia collo-cygni]